MTEVKKVLSAADIFAANDMDPIQLDMPEWGGTLFVRPLCGADLEFLSEWGKNKTKDQAIRLAVMTLVDADNKLLFDGPDAVEALKRKSMRALMRLQETILKLNGLDTKAKELAKND